jgi:hypothetical protein
MSAEPQHSPNEADSPTEHEIETCVELVRQHFNPTVLNRISNDQDLMTTLRSSDCISSVDRLSKLTAQIHKSLNPEDPNPLKDCNPRFICAAFMVVNKPENVCMSCLSYV